MAHDINIINRTSASGRKSRTSATRSVKKITTSGKTNKANNVAKALRTVRGAKKMSPLEMAVAGTAIGMLVREGVKTVNKGVDMVLDYQTAKTGEEVTYGNIKRVKNYIMNPVSYLIDSTWGARLIEMQNKRRNAINDYYQGLTGNMEYSEAFGKK